MFSPEGTVKSVRQARVRFSEPMIPFGDPRAAVTPFDIDCAAKGTARWVDERNWVYDFDQDLPGGLRCEFRVRQGLRTLAGNPIAGQLRFTFSTGGPAIRVSQPYEGSERIDEDQIFILELDCPATEASVLSNASFSVEGIASRVGVRTVTGAEREEILQSQRYLRYRRIAPEDVLLIQARQRFPAGSIVGLVWGRGISSRSGVATEEDQILPFVTRPAFQATFHCQRENAEADCLPITPMRLSFSAPVAWADVRKAVIRGPGGKQWQPEQISTDSQDAYVGDITFAGPFPERSAFTVEIPPAVKDDAGRVLTNADKFPLTVKTDEYPPLAKFAAGFGILELGNNPLLPVTLRNVEPKIAGRMLEVQGGEGYVEPRELRPDEAVAAKLRGKIFQVPPDKVNQMLHWIKDVGDRTWADRDKSVFGPVTSGKTQSFSIPKLEGPKAFEVVGIPLKAPGFYVVEIESELLGAALLGKPRPMYVPTTVLVTNLSVHLKWGTESSLVWVTTLDQAQPVNQASVEIRDCEGKVHWQGQTNREGIARVGGLPDATKLPQCSYDTLEQGLVVSAQSGNDMAFVHSSWHDGIEAWRFQLSREWDPSLTTIHTVFDRTLFRAGETVHMKHILRRHVTGGFELAPEPSQSSVVIHHYGSQQEYELPIRWDSNGSAETTWQIPKEAKLGQYSVDHPSLGNSGQFRVEEYRVPLMKGLIRPPSGDVVAPSAVPVDLTVRFLAGGAASGLPVRLRYQFRPRFVGGFEAFDDFVFSNGGVREGLVRQGEPEEEGEREVREVRSTDLTLDKSGSVRTSIAGLPGLEKPMEIFAELEFKDPNGEIQTVASTIPLWNADRLVGIKPASWQTRSESVKLQVAVTDLAGRPVPDAPVKVDLYQRKTYSHRKRLVGGFYAYEHTTEIKRLETFCEGRTDKQGLLACEKAAAASGNLIFQASTLDSRGRESVANRDIWVAGKEAWWFRAEDSDRIDLIPEKKRYEPGEKARFQVRMPFRQATALVTVEREGIGEALVQQLSGNEPVIELPVKGNYAPNVFVSVLVVRGRVSDVQPTATVDLGRPAYKLGIAEISVGWRACELKLKVAADRKVYKVRERARVKIEVKTADNKVPPQGSEVAVAAVDEGLLELMPNTSWDLLGAMMGRRGYMVQTSTAQMHVVGRRHFGLKALPQGGGGGRQTTRELFDTLLLWKGRIVLDHKGQAVVEVPLNDSITSFRIEAVATGGISLFGSGSTSIRSTQDLMIFSGIAPLVRQGDEYRSAFTIRNASERRMDVQVAAKVREIEKPLETVKLNLAAGESKEIGWNLTAPLGVESLTYEVDATGAKGAADRIRVTQKVVPAVPVRVYQATINQLENALQLDVERPKDALPGRGGIQVVFQSSLLQGLTGVEDYMRRYPYICLEQLVSKAVALRDSQLWRKVMEVLPSYIDSDGLAKYFPSMRTGSDTLTAYVLGIAHEAGWQIPDGLRGRMLQALQGFVEGRIIRYSSLPTADLSIRKMSAVEALSRYGQFSPQLLSSITISPNLWPTSAVLDWSNVLGRAGNTPGRAARLQEVEQILRSRLNFQGTTMGFSTEISDYCWWLMVSTDSNALRFLLATLESPAWKSDIARLVRGALGRQIRGHWSTTVANAWGVLAMEKFSRLFEKTPVTGQTTAALDGASRIVEWNTSPKGQTVSFEWPPQESLLELRVNGTGRPWATVQSLAAIPLKEPFFAGFQILKTITAVEQKESGTWNPGDIVRVKLELESASDMTWVVVSDPVPGGASILGTGLGRDSLLATQGEKAEGWVWPAFEERSFEAFRAYYQYVPKGKWSFEYTYRLNNSGQFQLPPTRVEALYAPEMFAEIPNGDVRVR
jgi:uncharacterized protein YfaS (alpha-2-macroglobulin family)